MIAMPPSPSKNPKIRTKASAEFCIPTSIEIDVTALDIGDSIHIEEVDLPADVESTHDVNFTVLTVVSPKVAETGDSEEDSDAAGESKDDE